MPPHKRISEKSYYVDFVTGCWNWQGAKTGKGYGSITIVLHSLRKTIPAHRFVFEKIRNIKLSSKQQLDHLCRNKKCVNPDHLEIVTNVQNVHRGNRCKITMEIAREIRKLHKERGRKKSFLAREFSLHKSTVGDIIDNKIWIE